MSQEEALTILKTGANVFLTGEPGSGKTHTINTYIAWLRDRGIEPAITAATGIAATHVGGLTIHSWSGLGIKEYVSKADVEAIAGREHIARRIQKAKVLVIDEISMLSSAMFSGVDAVCKEARRSELPFGGLQVVLVGDFFQLPPVSRDENAYAYESKSWHELNPLVCYLNDQFRQDDSDFLSILSAIRHGEVEELHYEQLMSRYTGDDVVQDVPKLFSHNADVDTLNAKELAKLSGKLHQYIMQGKGKDAQIEALKRGCLSPEVLQLKEGAVVMFTKNNPANRYVNGTLGKIIGFDSNGPIVETKEGEVIAVAPVEWQIEEEGKVRATISQVPLRLAYAITIHKSQGMSMDAAEIDLSRAFEYGQGYVALSRVRRLSGLTLRGLNARALEVHPKVLSQDETFRALSRGAQAAFIDMGPTEALEMHKKFVATTGGVWPKNTRSPRKAAIAK